MEVSKTRRLLVTSLALFVCAAAAAYAFTVVFGAQPVFINVRWSPTVDTVERQRVEDKYGLRLPEFWEGRTWSYVLTDPTVTKVEALVRDPAVEDTHNVNRRLFTVETAPPRPYVTPFPEWTPLALNVLSALFLLGGVVGLLLAVLGVAAPTVARKSRLAVTEALLNPHTILMGAVRQIPLWIRGWIPEVSAEAVALFRMVFGISLLIFFLNRPVIASFATNLSNVSSSFQQWALLPFVAAPWAADWIGMWLVSWCVLFIVGAFARTAFVLLTAGAFAWALLYTTQVTHHTITALMLTLVFLVGSRWGDAWSVDAWWHRGSRRTAPSAEYGYTVWLPGMVLGVVFVAAAFAKLRSAGLAWITNGTVKYHFLSDAPQAIVDWGLYVGQYPRLAVFLSFAAIAIESLVVVGVIAGVYRYRLVAGLAALSLLAGFSLFQGLLWPGWWMLLLSFLPWHLVPSTTERVAANTPRSGFHHAVIVAAVLTLILQQVAVTALQLEISPFVSTYDMYSTTYASPAEYEYKAGQSYWLVAGFSDRKAEACEVDRREAETVSQAIAGSAEWQAARPVLEECYGEVEIRLVSVEGRRCLVDWNRWPPLEVVHVPIAGPVDLK